MLVFQIAEFAFAALFVSGIILLLASPARKTRLKAIVAILTNRTFYVSTSDTPQQRPSKFAYCTQHQQYRIAEHIQNSIEADYCLEQVKVFLTNQNTGEELF